MKTSTNLSLYHTLLGDLKPHNPRKFNFLAIMLNMRRPSYASVVLFRLSAAGVRKGLWGKIFAFFWVRLNLALHACDIAPEADIGTGFLLPHPLGVTIGRVTMGQDVIVMQNVTLGIRSLANGYSVDPKDYPVIGDRAVISPGAVVLGGIRIGADATIGANAVVMEDVPDGCTAVGIPARVLVTKKQKT